MRGMKLLHRRNDAHYDIFFKNAGTEINEMFKFR